MPYLLMPGPPKAGTLYNWNLELANPSNSGTNGWPLLLRL
jgi:hypothetical protein